MTKITDMLGHEVRVGDRIAAAFRYAPYNGSYPELRSGTVVEIFDRKPMHSSYGKQDVTCLKVEWDACSEKEHVKLLMERRQKAKEEKVGHPLPRPAVMDALYRKTSSIMVEHKRFIRVG
jgi:hypothetical protein